MKAKDQPSFREHTRHADGIVLNIIGNPKYLMGREIKHLNSEILELGSPRYGRIWSLCYDRHMSSEMLMVEIFASNGLLEFALLF